MSRKERLTALFGGLLVISVWAAALVIVTRSSVQPVPRALPTEAALPTNQPATMTPVIIQQQPTDVILEPSETPQAVENRVIVHFAPDSTQAEREAYLESLGGTVARQIEPLNAAVLTLPDAASLPASPVIAASEPDYYATALLDVPTSDTYYAEQWGLDVIGAPDAWLALADDAPQVRVAVIDSGICAGHPDLAGRVLSGYDFVDGDSTPEDTFGHGCAVSGVIAANIDNSEGIAGVAPNAQIMPLRVLDGQGVGTYSDVAAAIIYAADQGAQVINLSLGGPNASNLLADAVRYAAERDVLVIAAAGNTGREGVLYPAAYEGVIAVGSIDPDLQRSSFSTYGPQIALLAPGRHIMTTRRDGAYAALSGTSMAAPHVSGAAAMLIAHGQTLELDGGILSLGESTLAQPTPVPVTVPPQYQALYDKAVLEGSVRVIVGLNAAYQPAAQLSTAQAQAQQANIMHVRSAVVSYIEALNADVKETSKQWQIPFVALQADPAALAYLVQSPDVVSIVEDLKLVKQLARSVPHIDADDVFALGYDGTGQTVAILDDGIDSGHEFFGGRVVAEACFSNAFQEPGDRTVCPNNQQTQIGAGAAGLSRCLNYDPCDHGTHVAGIAAGDDGDPTYAPSGVAKGASIIAVQVFTANVDCSSAPGSQPCLFAWTSDQIDGLLHVYNLSSTHTIAAVNLSLGSDTTYDEATCAFLEANDPSLNGAYSAAIDALESVDIATVIASGNSDDPFEMSFPACLPDAISVGSTGVAGSMGAITNVVSSFSNGAATLDLLAPGGYIVSAAPDDFYQWIGGTSMAAPHVTGAWAVLKQADPNATVAEVLAALKNSGVNITDTRQGANNTKPRIDLDGALSLLVPPLTVNTTSDDIIGTCDVTHCSLREAILAANSTANIKERIRFNIGSGQQTIVLGSSPLPIITNPVIIDGTTQPGYSGTPLIEIDGVDVTEADPLLEIGLNVLAGNSLIRGLVMNNFGSAAINLSIGNHNVVTGNYLGTEPNGTTAAPNREGVRICSSSNNRIGGTTTAERNIISGNSDDGMNICQLPGFSVPANNVIQGNYIGLTVTGSAVLSNSDDGINMVDAVNTLIGGTTSGARNVISGNGFRGIHIADGGSNVIQGNYIGPNAAGTQGFASPPSNQYGIMITSSDNLIGGTTNGARNVISGNDYAGIMLYGSSSNNTIQGNFVGTTAAGNAVMPNQNQGGIVFNENASDNLIGGTTSGAGNVISGNHTGIDIAANGNTIQGNFIGTNLNATLDLGNHMSGGIFISSDDNLIGGTAAGAGNVIAYNSWFGITVDAGSGLDFDGNAILGNRIFGSKVNAQPNSGLGIDLDAEGVTANDPGDSDDGFNHLQNFPVLTSAEAVRNMVTIGGTLNSAANTTYRIEFFRNSTCDLSGHGEGQFFLGAQDVTTDGSGNATFSVDLPVSLTGGQQITATATDPNNNTSEFSACLSADYDPEIVAVNTSDGATDDGICDAHCTLIDAIRATNGFSGVQTVVFKIPGSGPHIIQTTIPLVTFSQLIIDGTTQAGYTGTPLIILDGSLLSSGSGFTPDASVTIKGLAIRNFPTHGIRVTGSNNIIGGGAAGEGNVISDNDGDGVFVEFGTGNNFIGNTLENNGGLGIDLGANGVTPNDNGDGDSGANDLQNFPVISQVVATIADVRLDVTLNSKANTTYRLDFYNSDICDASGHGEGSRYLGSANATTNASGDYAGTIIVPQVVASGTFMTLTATDPSGSTSEFSACAEAILYVATPLDFDAQVLSEIDTQLSWTDDSIDETHWLIERSLAGQNNWTQITGIPTSDEGGTGAAVTYHDTTFLCSKSYDYRMRASNEPGGYYSLYTPIENGAPVCPTLNAPDNFGLSAAQRQIDLTWTDTNTTETGYRIDHSTDGGQTWALLATAPANAQLYSHTGLICNTGHSYRVRAVRDHDNALSDTTPVQAAMTTICPTLFAPASPAASALSRSTIQFTWADGSPGQTTAFHLERSANGTDWTQFAVVPVNIASVIDSNLNCGQNYQYRARAFRLDDNAFSPYSAAANATTSSCPTPVSHTVGLYKDGVWQFWETTQTNQPAITFGFGPQESGWMPVIGDWDGDGVDGIGLYKNGLWLLRNATGGGSLDSALLFGPAESGWMPVVGDWDGDGVDGIGVYKNGLWLLRQTPTQGQPDMTFGFGPQESGWKAVAGDWDGGGTATVGLFKDGLWLLSNQLPAAADVPPFLFGQTGWMPVAGDWDQDSRETTGIYKDGVWQLRNSASGGVPDAVFGMTIVGGWQPVSVYEGGLSGLTMLSLPPDNQPTAVPTTPVVTTPAAPDVPTATATTAPEVTEEPTLEVTEEVIPTSTPEPSPTETPPPSATPEPETPELETPDEVEVTEAVEG